MFSALLSAVLLLGATLAPAAAEAASEVALERQRVSRLYPHDGPPADGTGAANAIALDDAPEAGSASDDGTTTGGSPRWLWVLAGFVGIGLMANGRMR